MKFLFLIISYLLQPTNAYLKYTIIQKKINNTNYTRKLNITDQHMERAFGTLFY